MNYCFFLYFFIRIIQNLKTCFQDLEKLAPCHFFEQSTDMFQVQQLTDFNQQTRPFFYRYFIKPNKIYWRNYLEYGPIEIKLKRQR